MNNKRVIRPKENMALYFHELSKDISMGGLVNIPKDITKFPVSWTTVEYKEYKFAKKIYLLKRDDCKIDSTFDELIYKRKTSRDFKSRKYKISLKELSTLLYYSIARMSDDTTHRVHPSGGSRYSLEYYIYINNSTDVARGIYHFNILENSLELINDLLCEEDVEKAKNIFGYEFAYFASSAIFMTSVFDRNMRKYGERGYRYILLEAGHVGENFYLAATSLNLSVCALTGTRDKIVEELLEVDGKNESLVFTVLIG